MKKISVIVYVVLITIILAGCAAGANANSYLRIHIRAHSNMTADQDIKYEIKDQVINFLTPVIANCNSLSQVKSEITKIKNEIEQFVDAILLENNFNYKSAVKIANEFFPTRYYGNLLLEANFYDAIIIELGSGEGDNWWCVVYPPLCFVDAVNIGNNNFVYKSKILELVERFFKK